MERLVRALRALSGLWLATLAHFAAAQAPQGLTGTLIVLNKESNDASFIDLATGDALATLPTGNNPHEIVVTDDGRWAIGSNYRGGDSLTVFDVQNLSVARTIDLSEYPAPHGLSLLPGQTHVLVTSEDSRRLVVVDFHSGEVEKSIATGQPGSHMVALTEDGTTAFTANTQGNSVSVIDVQASRTPNVLRVPARPEAIAANRAGTDVWAGSNDAGVVSVIDPTDGSVRRQLTGFSWPYRVLLTRDERYVAIPDARSEMVRVFDAATGRELAKRAFSEGGPQGVALHPDDRTLFLSLSRQGKVVVLNIENLEVIGEYETGRGPDGIGYSQLRLR